MVSVSWRNREFEVHPHNAAWSAASGIYVFTGENPKGKWVPLYIGQASSFKDRIPTHERWEEARRLGATHVHVRVVSLQMDRDAIEKEMIEAWKPKLNTQYK